MNKKEVIRYYNFSDAVLIMKGRTIIAFIRRDKEQFKNYAVTTNSLNDLSILIDQFAESAPDVMKLGDQKIATEDKDGKAEELRVIIRDVMTHVASKYKENTARYKKFGTGALSQVSDETLLVISKTVVACCKQMFSELEVTGLTNQKIEHVGKVADSLSDLMVTQRLRIGDRDIDQEDRVENGNQIYTELVRLCDIGRNIWQTTNVAKTNDYIIYNTVSGEKEDDGMDPEV
mgnify:FL=1